MKNDIETELLSHELGMSYLHPITLVTWKRRIADIAIVIGSAIVLGAAAYVLIVLAALAR